MSQTYDRLTFFAILVFKPDDAVITKVLRLMLQKLKRHILNTYDGLSFRITKVLRLMLQSWKGHKNHTYDRLTFPISEMIRLMLQS